MPPPTDPVRSELRIAAPPQIVFPYRRARRRRCDVSGLGRLDRAGDDAADLVGAAGERVGDRQYLAKYFRGLGDPTRLRILRLLDEAGELSAGGLVSLLQMPQPTVSTHLACLRWCAFVATRRDNRSVISCRHPSW